MFCISFGETSPDDLKNCLTPIKKADFVEEKLAIIWGEIYVRVCAHHAGARDCATPGAAQDYLTAKTLFLFHL